MNKEKFLVTTLINDKLYEVKTEEDSYKPTGKLVLLEKNITKDMIKVMTGKFEISEFEQPLSVVYWANSKT